MTITNASQAIRFEMAGGTIDNTTIESVSMESNSSRGIEVHNATTVTNLTLQSCTFDDCSTGIRTASSGIIDGADILDCTFSDQTLGFYNANDGGTSLVRDILVDGCTFTGHSFAGFFAEEIQDTTVQNCLFLDNATGFYIFKAYATTGGGIDVSNVVVQNNEFVNTTGTGRAMLLFNETPAAGVGFDGIIVTCNVMTGGAIGVHVFGDSDRWDTIHVNFNQIFGNAEAVTEGSPVGANVIDFENNWWGDGTGPLDPIGTVMADNDLCADPADLWNPFALGDPVPDETVDYCPWLEAADEVDLALTSTSPDWLPVGGTLTVTIDMANPKDDVVGGQFYLDYDPTVLSFVGATPGDPPFTVEVIPPIDSGSTIFYAVGVPLGDDGTDADTTMAVLTFTTLDETCATSGLVSFAAPSPPLQTRLTNEFGQPIAAATTDLGTVTVDSTPPVITCPPDIMVACVEDAGPGLLYGVADGGVGIYYNDNGDGENPDNQAYFRAQFSVSEPTVGAPYVFDNTPLTGTGPFSFQILYSGLVWPESQFGFDLILPLPTADGSVIPPVLDAWDNGDGTLGGRIAAGPVTWAINDYKPHLPDITAGDVLNSLIRSQAPGVPADDVMIFRNDVSVSGTVFTAVIEGKLVADGIHHWFTPSTPDSPMSNFGLTGEIFFSATLTYDSSTDVDPLVDFYEGPATLVANFPSAETGFATATDNCTLFPTIGFSDVDNGGGGCNGDPLIITRTWSATDACGRVSTCDQTITVLDDVDPTFLSVPDDVTVMAELGGCTATVDPGEPTVTDNCLAGATFAGVRDDAAGLGDPYPAGDTEITWTATDACGNTAVHVQVITVEPVNELILDVDLFGSLDAVVERCFEFEFSGNDTAIHTEIIQLDLAGSASGVSVLIPCGDFDCLTLRDPLHTLASSVDVTVNGSVYEASVTGADSLVGGNFNDDPFIDILDFGILVGQFGPPLPIDTDCSTPAPHADITGNGFADGGDFTFVSINFLEASDTGCTVLAQAPPAAGPLGRGPVTRIAVSELRRRGLDDLAVADLNGDGWLDQADVAAFMGGARP